MSDYLTEQEQVQLLINWVKRYGPTIILGIVIAALISGGWQYWQTFRTKTLLQASTVYDEMLTARAQNNAPQTVTAAKQLISNYASTPYAEMAGLMLARDAVLKKNYPEAVHQLDWVMDHGQHKVMRQIARIREARVLIAQNQPSAALALLKKVNDPAFSGLVDEINGDAYLALNDKINARQAYGLALSEIPNADINRPILRMKYDSLNTENKTL